MIRGDDVTFDVEVTDDGDPVPLDTATSIRFTAKRSLEDADADAVLALSLGDGITVDVAETHIAHLVIPAASTDQLQAPTYLVWDIEVTDEDGLIHTVAEGLLHITADVTRDPLGS